MYKSRNFDGVKYGRQISLINTMRELWDKHVIWTRMFIISAVSGLGDLSLVTQRLLANPGHMADVLRRYYGYDKSRKFESLLRDHLLIAANLVNDAISGDTAAADADREKWYANADEIAEFLAGINPFWKKDEWRNLLHEHLRMTENEAVYRLTEQYSDDIENFDDIQNEALLMGDYMAEGILRQFNI
jgi:hypothetical protein